MSRYTRFILAFLTISLISFVDMFAATAPTNQARFIGVNNITSTSMDISFSKGNGGHRIVVVSPDGTVETPQNGATYGDAGGSYTTGNDLGNGDKVVDVLDGAQASSHITGLTSGVTYKIQVFEFNTGGSPVTAYNTGSGLVNPRSATTLVEVNPPTDLAANVTSATTVDLSWTAASPAPDGYIFNLYVDNNGEGSGDGSTYSTPETNVSPYTELDITDTTAFDLSELVGLSDYKYKVRSYIGNSESASDSLIFFTPPDNTPPKFVSFELQDGAGTDGVINESNVEGNVHFVVLFSEKMKTWLTPSFAFSNTTALTFLTGNWGGDGTSYEAEFSVADNDDEFTDEDITVSNAEDLNGNSIDVTKDTVNNAFSIDLKQGELDYNYTTANEGIQTYCRSGANEDKIVLEINVTESGYNAANISASSFDIGAQDQSAISGGFGFTQIGGPENGAGTYIFSHTLTGSEVEGPYNVHITFTDGAGNQTHLDKTGIDDAGEFNIENTAPVVSDLQITGEDGSCVSNGDDLEFTFKVVEQGCGTFDESNLNVTITGPSSQNPANSLSSFAITDGDGSSENPFIFTGTLAIAASDADGGWNIKVDATDAAGNVGTNTTTGAFTIDNTEPEISNVQIANTCVNGSDVVTLTFNVVEEGCGTFDNNDITVGDNVTTTNAWTWVSGTGNGPYTYTLALVSGDPDGLVTVSIDAKDDAGNTATTNSDATFTIDNTAPVISNASITPSCENGGDVVTLTFDVVEAGCGTFDKDDIIVGDNVATLNAWTWVSGSGNGPYTYTLTLTASDPDGLVSVTIDATDDAGNTAAQNTDASFKIDNTAPTLDNFTMTSATCVNNGTGKITFTFTGYDEGCGTFDESDLTVTSTTSNQPTFVSRTGSNTSGDPYVFTYSIDIADNDGGYDITVGATDDAGNAATQIAPTGNEFNVDNTAPTVTIVDPTTSTVANGSKVIDFTANDVNGCGTMVTEGSVNGGSNWHEIESGTSTLGNIPEFGPLSDDPVTLSVRTTDGAGNVSTTASVTLTKDATPPTITSITPSDTQISKADGGEDFSILIEFNEGMDQTTAPTVTITSNSTLPTTNSGGSWQNVTTYKADFGQINVATQEAIEDLDVSVSGARDDAEDVGNLMATDNTSGLNKFSIDTEDPLISFDNGEDLAPAESTCVSGDENVYYTASDKSAFSGLATQEASINTGSYETVTSGFTLSSLTDWNGLGQGAFTLHLKATDNFGNTTDITRTLNKDDVAPVFSAMTSASSCVKGETQVTVTFTVTEGGACDFDVSNLEVYLDDLFAPQSVIDLTSSTTRTNSASPYTFSTTFTTDGDIPEGDYTFYAVATDVAGNTRNSAIDDGQSVSISVDKTGPNLTNLVTSSTPSNSATPTRVGGTTTTLNIDFDAESFGCSEFDPTSVVYTITGPGGATLANDPPSNPTFVSGTKWRTTILIDGADTDGDYQISIHATDELGNPSNTLDPAGVEFVVDNTKPIVNIVKGIPDLLNRADDGANNFYIEFQYNEDMDITVNPTYSFPATSKQPTVGYSPSNIPALTNAATPPIDAGWQANKRAFRFYFDVNKNSEIEMDQIPVKASGGKDIVGNTCDDANQANVFSIDMITPNLANVVATPSLVTDNYTVMNIDFTFDEPMNILLTPTITFPLTPNVANAVSINSGASGWFTNKIYRASYNVIVSSDVEYTNVQVKIENAEDEFGNPFSPTPYSNVFSVDTKEPSCVAVTTNPSPVTVTTNALSFDVTVQMDQTLDDNENPIITYGTSSATYTVDSTGIGYGFSTTNYTNDTYKFKVTHDGTPEEITNNLMTISGFKDLSGNVQTEACSTHVDIDTKRPTITSITVSDNKICRSDDGTTETITITFSEPMSDGVFPTISFNNNIENDGILTGGNGQYINGNTQYKIDYTIDATDEFTYTGVDVQVSGAEDEAGNVMTTDNTTGQDKINVDTKKPNITDIAFNPIPSNAFGVNRSNIGGDGFEVVLTYDEAMDQNFTPTITFSQPQGTGTVDDALEIGSGSWNSPTNTIYTQQYTVNNASVELEDISADVTGATDPCGNPQNSYRSDSLENYFSIDLIAPTCSTLVADTDPIYEGNLTQGLTVTFSEPMASSPEPEFSFANSENFTFGQGTWNTSYQYSVTATHSGTEEEIPTEIVSLSLANTQPTDMAGNPVESATCSDQFTIDTKKPTVTSVVFNPTKIIGTTEGFSVAVTFNEAMGSTNPTLTFSTGSSIFSPAGGDGWVGNTYTFHYSVTDGDLDVDGITVDISGAKDVAGNVMATHTSTESFNIDQVEPTVTSVTFSNSPGWINRSNIGTENFSITIVYSESMNDGVSPTITLEELSSNPSPSINDALVSSSGSWTTTNVSNDTYTEIYNVVDVAAAGENLDATITNAQDVCGNIQESYTTNVEGDGAIDIDLIAPNIAFNEGTPLSESCVGGAESIYYFTSDTLGVDDVYARIGSGTYSEFSSGSLLNTVDGWSSALEGSITLYLKIVDWAGNETTISRNFNKDVTAPVISNITKGTVIGHTCVKAGDTYYVDFDATDIGGCGTFDENDISITESLANDFVFVSKTGNRYRYSILIDAGDPNGNRDYTIHATDDAGNTTSVNPPGFDIYIDNTAPVVSNIQITPPTCVAGGSTVTLTFNLSDNGNSNCQIGQGNIEINDNASTENDWTYVSGSGNGTYTYTLLIDGNDPSQNVDVWIDATDVAGNTSTGNGVEQNDFTIDNTAPVFSAYQNGSETTCLTGEDYFYFSVYVTEDGCSTFDESNITVTVNGTVTNSVQPEEGNPTGTGRYYFYLPIDGNDASGEYNLTFSGSDGLGNAATPYSPTGNEFKIDNTPPVIAITSPLDGHTVNGTKAVSWTENDGDGCGFDHSEFSVNETTWTASSSVTDLADITDFSGLPDGSFTLYMRGYDVVGNSSTVSINLIKDTEAPTVLSAVASDNMLSIADHGNAFSVAVTFDEGMDIGTNPTVTLTSNSTVATTNTGGSWNTPTNTVFTATFGTINGGSNEEIADLDVTVSGAKDDTEDDGNLMSSQTVNDVFSIDTKAPTCSTLVVDTDPIYEGNLVQGITVTFSEPMSNAVNPSFDFTNSNNFTSFTGANWVSSTEFSINANHNGNEETIPTEIVSLSLTGSLPTDLAGNPAIAPACTTSFAIDTRKPMVSNVVFTPTLVTETTTTFSVAVTFDENMGSTVPSLSFNGGVGLAFSSAGGDSWVGNTYTFHYNVSDQNYNLTGLTVNISGAKDVAGNVMLPMTSTQTYAIDQVAPTISSSHIESNNGHNPSYAKVGNTISLTLTPSEQLDNTKFTGNIGGHVFTVTDNYSLNNTYTLSVIVLSGDAETTVAYSIDYKDLNGNSGATFTNVSDASTVTIDKTAPIATITQAVGQSDPTSTSPVNFKVSFNEAIFNFENSDISLSGTANPTTANVTNIGGNDYNVAVTGMTGTGTVIINLNTNMVIDIADNGNGPTINSDNSVDYNVAGATIVEDGGGTEPATISSLVNDASAASLNFDFKVTDDYGNQGADNLPTLITNISIGQGTGNVISDWTGVIAGAELYDGSNTVAGTINTTSIDFSGLAHGSGQIGEVLDNGNKTYTLKVWLKSSPSEAIDNKNLAFKVNRSSFNVDNSGSSFASGDGTNIESGSSNNEIQVIATEFAFTTIPTYTVINTNTLFVIEAQDVNGNRDYDYSANPVTLTADKSTISSGGSGAMSNGTLTLNTVKFSTSAENDFATASDGNITDGVSGNFNIKEAEPLSVTNLSIISSANSFTILYNKADTSNTLLLAKEVYDANLSYGDENSMDNETGWGTPSTVFGTTVTPADNQMYVIYAGRDSVITMTNLQGPTPKHKYSVAAYSYNGALNSAVQNFNIAQTSARSFTHPKESNLNDGMYGDKGIGMNRITPHPASINGNVSINIMSIEQLPLTLELYDTKGAKVMTIFSDRIFDTEENTINFNIANTVSSGQYFLRLNGGGQVVIAPFTIVN